MPTQPSFLANLIRTVYELISHNYVVIAYFSAFLISLFFAIKKPTRTNTLLVIGFALLVFNFEYEKHISEPLRAQTELSLTRGGSFKKLRSLTKILFEFLVPIGTYFAGWTLILISLYANQLKKTKN